MIRVAYHNRVASDRRADRSAVGTALCLGLLTAVALLIAAPATNSIAGQPDPNIVAFMEDNCFDCHEGNDAEGGLDLVALAGKLNEQQLLEESKFERWTRIFDRVQSGEMPPPEEYSVDKQDREAFLKAVGSWIWRFESAEDMRRGRVRDRRLTNLQLERCLHNLLGIDTPLTSLMTDEPRVEGFVGIADIQSISHFLLEQHLVVVDAALDEAMHRALAKTDMTEKEIPAEKIARKKANQRNREPELIGGNAVVWSGGPTYYGQVRETRAPEDGWYRFTIRAKALNSPKEHGVWCTVRTGLCVASAPQLTWAGAFEAERPYKNVTIETWLPAGHMLEIRPGDKTLKQGKFNGGQVDPGVGEKQNVPGLAVKSISMQRVHLGLHSKKMQRLLFGDLRVSNAGSEDKVKVLSRNPEQDAGDLMLDFASRAFRRPVAPNDIAPYTELVHTSLKNGQSFHEAVRSGYRALLCSPRFLYMQETPGRLDDYAMATRLSMMLWNQGPDDELLELAAKKELCSISTLARQVDRMLADPLGKLFVKDLANQWLDLNLIDFTEPDKRLYPGFDVIVQESMLEETHAYLQHMLEQDLSVDHLIDSNFTFLNNRLARYYGIEGVNGDQMQKVRLKAQHHRGGLVTQGSIMKVTANGTDTSPVIRGVWVSQRLLGETIPPPPQNVPAIEPDIRGAKTIRELLDKHKADKSCAVCHVKIDPPGFALETYDPSGRWRDTYVSKKVKKKNQLPVDARSEMPDGRKFNGIEEFQKLILKDPKPLARNVVAKLLTYGTGEDISFKDRFAVDEIVERAAPTDYGFRSLLKAVVTSKTFLTK